MRFVKFNGWSEKSITFLMDFVGSIKPEDGHTLVELVNGEILMLEIEYEDFISRIFSDRPNEKEYELIEIDYTDPEPTTQEPNDLVV